MTIEIKAIELIKKLDEIEEALGDPKVHLDQERYRQLTQKHSYLTNVKESLEKYQNLRKQIDEYRSILSEEKDYELVELAREEIATLEKDFEKEGLSLQTLLVPPDPRDSRNIVIEIRAGTGGDEAALFVGDLVRMYQLNADHKGWKVEPLSSTPSDLGGYKEYIMAMSGRDVFRLMQYEAGTHRVQRVPETETQGRIHTSAVTVAVLLEPTEDEKIDIDEKELKIDTYRASGAGGQHVNVTDSAVRITHLPTNTVVSCQDERSQHKNKEKAMRVLMTKLLEQRKKKQQEEMSTIRQSQIGSGDRSERIRTYNYPQNRVTDHRINLTTYDLDQVMNGNLDKFSNALVTFYHENRLSQ